MPQLRLTLSFTISLTSIKLMSIESVRPSNHLILCHPLFLPPSIFPSIRVFSKELALWPKYWNFSISPSNEYSVSIYLGLTGLISLLSKDCQESSLAPRFESINSSSLSLLHGPNLISVHDSWP